MKIKLVLSLVVTAFIVLFPLQNTTIVEIKFLFWSLSMSRSLMIVVFVALGVAIGWMLRSNVSFKKLRQ